MQNETYNIDTHLILPPCSETAEILNKIVNKTIGRIGSQYERPWHITFTRGNYGHLYTALCEMQGSPVRATIIVHLDSSNCNMAVLDSGLNKCRKSIPDNLRADLKIHLIKLCP